ncbi:unnamed protein product [Polarella glacialis]|uniref:PDEase domain-containing protein n=1 Tax=Polarella glacialis TaxID=89957 RepID=A0A813HTU2_POLGL|nr:unnamed protein product [Polarella glacialis]
MGNAACGDCSSKDAAAAATESVCATGAKSVLEPSLDRQLDPSPRAEDDIENDTGNPLFLSAPSSARCMPSWDFNPIGMSSEQLCHQACQLMIPSYALCGGSKAPVLQHFIKSVADGHQPNAFHNFAHAVDALQAVCIQGALIQWKPLVTPCMRFSMAVSALAVDLGHPGVDNTFLVDTRHELACSYNDISPLENMHCSKLFRILQEVGSGVLGHLPSEVFKEVRNIMIDAILHTDPSRYETVVEQVRALCDQGVTTLNIDSNCQTEVRQALTRALLITGDLSHQMRTCETANAWASLLQSELCLQGDREKELGLPVAPIRDRSRQPHRADFQLYLGWSRIAPLLGAQVWFFPTLEPAASQLKDNASSWAKELQSSGFESQVEQASLNPGAGRAKQICVLLDASRPYPLVKGNGESRSGAIPRFEFVAAWLGSPFMLFRGEPETGPWAWLGFSAGIAFNACDMVRLGIVNRIARLYFQRLNIYHGALPIREAREAMKAQARLPHSISEDLRIGKGAGNLVDEISDILVKSAGRMRGKLSFAAVAAFGRFGRAQLAPLKWPQHEQGHLLQEWAMAADYCVCMPRMDPGIDFLHSCFPASCILYSCISILSLSEVATVQPANQQGHPGAHPAQAATTRKLERERSGARNAGDRGNVSRPEQLVRLPPMHDNQRSQTPDHPFPTWHDQGSQAGQSSQSSAGNGPGGATMARGEDDTGVTDVTITNAKEEESDSHEVAAVFLDYAQHPMPETLLPEVLGRVKSKEFHALLIACRITDEAAWHSVSSAGVDNIYCSSGALSVQCGFVTFLHRRDAEVALKMTYRASGLQPPDPSDVIYQDLQQKEASDEDWGSLLGFTAVAALFWAFAPFIVAFSAVAQLQTLGTLFPILDTIAPGQQL